MVQTVLFLSLSLIIVVLLAVLLCLLAVFVIRGLRAKSNRRLTVWLRRLAICAAALLALNAALVAASQLMAHTPPIVNSRGETVEGSIAELTQLTLNGRKQWISIRGLNRNNPVLLFLAGGPGGTQLAAVRHELPQLEERFVVVGWDQPGAGKSFGAADSGTLTPETYVEDGYALTEYLQERFAQQKIYLIGESWGSALGIFLLDRHPEAYSGFIGTGQMVDFSETERLDYEKALEIALANGNQAIADRLLANGPAPYTGADVVWKSAAYLNYLSGVMAGNPAITNAGYQTLRDIASEEYGLLDRINYIRGVIVTFGKVYPQLYGVDLRKDYQALSVPVWFFLGRYDLNAPPSLAEEYAALLQAPHKEIVWFEHSGHSPWINENERFAREVIARFLGKDGNE